MTDSLQDLKKELEKSLRRYKKKVALLSSAESSSNSGKSAKRKAQALLQKTENQLQQLTALLNSERRDVFILDDPHTTSSSLLQHKNQMFIERKTARPEQSKSVDNDSTGNGDNKRHDNGNDGRIRSIVILVAMEEEARPFLERHNLVENVGSWHSSLSFHTLFLCSSLCPDALSISAWLFHALLLGHNLLSDRRSDNNPSRVEWAM